MWCAHDGPYAAQLQLVRTLQPPPLEGDDARGRQSKGGRGRATAIVVRAPSLRSVGVIRSLSGCCACSVRPANSTETGCRGRGRQGLRSRGGDGALCNRYWDVYHNVLPVGVLVQIYPAGRTSVQTTIAIPIAPAPIVPK